MKTIIIVAMTPDRLIGKDGRLPWRLPEDLKFFKRTTTGYAAIMGRKTHESIGRPLPNRRNIVMTRSADYRAEGAEVVGSLEEALERCRNRGEEKAFVIGGAQVYRLALPIADELIITRVDGPDLTGDTYFPEWTASDWISKGPTDRSYPAATRFCTAAAD